jgi:hypothetical protein
LKYKNRQNELSGRLSETCRKEKTSPIINSITKPRYASTEDIRRNGGLTIGGAAITAESSGIVESGIWSEPGFPEMTGTMEK